MQKNRRIWNDVPIFGGTIADNHFFYIFVPEFNLSNLMEKLNRIKVVLVEKDKTGKWLAEQLGKSTTTVSKWCSNTTQPDLTTLNAIAKLLNVDIK